MKTFSIFVDPEKIGSVVRELEYEGLTVTNLGAGGPAAIVHFKGEQPALDSFLENNSFEIVDDHVTEET
jgi:hypothetical protein